MRSVLESVKRGGHILAIYRSKEEKIEEAFQFLKAGLDGNEAVVLITGDMTKDEVREHMTRQWKNINIEDLELKGDILIITTREGYFPDGKVEIDKIISQWQSISESAIGRGNNALRVFGDMAGFFNCGLTSELIDYESSLPVSYGIPVIGLCAYEAGNIGSLTPEQLSILHQHHGIHLMDGYDVLANPQNNSHVLLVYENDVDFQNATAKYINEGLKRGHLCVYATVHKNDKQYIKSIAPRILDFEKNVEEGNLLIAELAPIYIAAVCGDLTPYNNFADQLVGMTRNRKDKHVRFVEDCASFLFQNRHFDECVMFESQGQQKHLFGSHVCPYLKSMFDKYPFNYQKIRLLANHDLATDSSGRIIAIYLSKNVARKEDQ